jgi:hypothetical protein
VCMYVRMYVCMYVFFSCICVRIVKQMAVNNLRD